jgi:hypothetical protein
LLHFGHHADAGIGHGEKKSVSRIDRPGLDGYPPLRAELHGVGEQIEEHLPQTTLVAKNLPWQVVGDPHLQAVAPLLCSCRHERYRRLNELANRERSRRDGESTFLQLREIQNIVDDRQQMTRRVLGRVEVLANDGMSGVRTTDTDLTS